MEIKVSHATQFNPSRAGYLLFKHEEQVTEFIESYSHVSHSVIKALQATHYVFSEFGNRSPLQELHVATSFSYEQEVHDGIRVLHYSQALLSDVGT